MSAPDYNIDAGASVCCRYCDARRNCQSTTETCTELAEYAEMREQSAQIAAVVLRFSTPAVRARVGVSIADLLADEYGEWFDEAEFLAICKVGTGVPA
jgi:hypothetical protein